MVGKPRLNSTAAVRQNDSSLPRLSRLLNFQIGEGEHLKAAQQTKPSVVISGGGFGGLRAAKLLGNQAVEVTLIDRKNHHSFQPLLYQVATAILSPGEIALPIRHVLRRYKNVKVVLGEVGGFDNQQRLVTRLDGSQVPYDYLIVCFYK